MFLAESLRHLAIVLIDNSGQGIFGASDQLCQVRFLRVIFRGGVFNLGRILSAAVVAFGPGEIEIDGHSHRFICQLGPGVSHGLLSM